MNIKPKGLVAIPKHPRAIGSVLPWCKGVNRALQQLRDRTMTVPVSKGGTSAAATECPFGKIVSYEISGAPKRGIRGGIIHCGDQNFEVPNQVLDLTASGDWLVYISQACVVNRDDDNVIFLAGVDTGTAPSGTWGKVVWSGSATYPDNTPPVLSSGAATIILPIGRLTIADGRATLIPSGCGNFTIGHCAGSVSYSRA